ncbi:MAG: VWA domain-containing protein, partial [Deltaproteobacteria bacterium]
GDGTGADSIGFDATQIDQVTFKGTTYDTSSPEFDTGTGNWTINADYGTLIINQDGSYSYTSGQAVPVISAGGSNNLNDWTTATTLYGYSAGRAFIDGSGNLDLGNANANVQMRNNNGLYIGGGGDGNELDQRNGNSEAIAIDLGELASTAQVQLRDVDGNDGGTWRAYDDNGVFVASGTFANQGGNRLTINIDPGANFQYLVFTGTDNNDEYNIWSLNYQQVVPAIPAETFDYTLVDTDGDSSTATLTVSHDTNLLAADDVAVVDESGLPGGTQEGIAQTTVTGNLLANDVGVGPNVSIDDVDGVTPAGGVITINTAHGTLTVYAQSGGGFQAGDYVYTLNSATTEGVDDVETFTYSISDNAGNSSSGQLAINIADDAPVGTDVDHTLQAASTAPTYNLVIVLDRSGSMGWDANGNQPGDAGFDPNTVRMDIAKSALAQMLDQYDKLGNVNVQIVDFSSDVRESGWYVDNKYGAVDYINSLHPNGGTRYNIALDQVMNGFAPPPADKTLVYFISDGEPNTGYEVDATQQAQWETFVTNNVDISFGIGIGEVSLTSLLPIAYPDDDLIPADGQEDYAIKVTDATQLVDTLLATVDSGVAVGDVSVLTGSGANGLALGADGGYIQSFI